MKKILKSLIIIFFFISFNVSKLSAETSSELLKVDWSFKSFFGKFDRASLQRGFQVYKEVCASCHSMRLLSYRNLGEKGGPEFSITEVFMAVSGAGDVSITAPGQVSTKSSEQLEFSTGFKDDDEATAQLFASSTSGGSTTCSAYRINLLAN